LPPTRLRFWRKRNRWVVLPYTVVKRHRAQHRHLRALRELFEASPYDVACRGAGAERLAIIAVGNMAGKLRDMPGEDGETYDRLALSSVWPLPEESLLTWLAGTRRVLVLEEGSAFVEGELRALLQRAGVDLPVLGRQNGAVPEEGELGQTEIAKALRALDPTRLMPAGRPAEREMPSTQALCPECPYRPTFAALLAAMERHGGRNRHIVIGETGCMVRGNLAPYELFDIKYSLGSGLGVGLGLALSDGRHRPVAVLGDSSFFHSDLNALPYAVQMDAPLTVLVLDNGTTALTGGQPHPGSPADERGRPRPGADLAAAIAGCGIAPRVVELSGGGAASAATALDAALDAALAAEGLAEVIVLGAVPALRWRGLSDGRTVLARRRYPPGLYAVQLYRAFQRFRPRLFRRHRRCHRPAGGFRRFGRGSVQQAGHRSADAFAGHGGPGAAPGGRHPGHRHRGQPRAFLL
jgi:TPP-dependent indolepyruvate ferredoxin oxidoreductase alpha subunit